MNYIKYELFIIYGNIKRPALSFRIAQDYFENNFNDPNNDYTLNNGFYERTIEEADLDFAFGDSNDRKFNLRWLGSNLFLKFQKSN